VFSFLLKAGPYLKSEAASHCASSFKKRVASSNPSAKDASRSAGGDENYAAKQKKTSREKNEATQNNIHTKPDKP
jgi:hypothetical protein